MLGRFYLIDNQKRLSKRGEFDSECDDWLNGHMGFLLWILSNIPVQE